MVEVVYLPHNYELTGALLELKGHYVNCKSLRALSAKRAPRAFSILQKKKLNKENPSKKHFLHTDSPAFWINISTSKYQTAAPHPARTS